MILAAWWPHSRASREMAVRCLGASLWMISAFITNCSVVRIRQSNYAV